MEQQHQPNDDRPHGQETEPHEVPRIYVASLSDYNNGELHGEWIDATQPVDAIHEHISAMLRRSRDPGAEEYAIHDFEGFGPVRLSEYESVDTVARIAAGIVEHGEAFAHWAANVSNSVTELAVFDDFYIGTWPSLRAYVEELVADAGIDTLIDAMPTPLRSYIRVDIELLARDIEIEDTVCEGTEGVHIFVS